jgi:hypothetical protein
MVPLL